MDILVGKGLGTQGASTGIRLGVGDMTDAPDDQIVIYDSPGQHGDSAWLLDYPYVQVQTRSGSNSYQLASTYAREAYDALLGIDPQNMPNGDRIDGITSLGMPNFIGKDDKQRPIFSLNLRLIFEPAPTTLANRAPL